MAARKTQNGCVLHLAVRFTARALGRLPVRSES